MKRIDLHVHTTFSDGSLSPSEVVSLAADSGIAAIAITDHDNAGGCKAAVREGALLGVEVIPGIEISSRYSYFSAEDGRKKRCPVHILGYYIDPEAPAARSVLNSVINDRNERNRKICRLMQEDGLGIDYEKMTARFGTSIGRPHFAAMLVELGLAESVNDAFARYMAKGCRYYIPRSLPSVGEAIGLILCAGGLPVLAHPYQYRLSASELRELITQCTSNGLLGMECRYSGYSAEQSDALERLADESGLFKTGGSDFHGSYKPQIGLGTGTGQNPLSVPYEWLEIMKTTGRKNK